MYVHGGSSRRRQFRHFPPPPSKFRCAVRLRNLRRSSRVRMHGWWRWPTSAFRLPCNWFYLWYVNARREQRRTYLSPLFPCASACICMWSRVRTFSILLLVPVVPLARPRPMTTNESRAIVPCILSVVPAACCLPEAWGPSPSALLKAKLHSRMGAPHPHPANFGALYVRGMGGDGGRPRHFVSHAIGECKEGTIINVLGPTLSLRAHAYAASATCTYLADVVGADDEMSCNCMVAARGAYNSDTKIRRLSRGRIIAIGCSLPRQVFNVHRTRTPIA